MIIYDVQNVHFLYDKFVKYKITDGIHIALCIIINNIEEFNTFFNVCFCLFFCLL